MNARKTGDLPARLENVRRRFAEWRKTHRARSRLPSSLWAAAVKMADKYGLHRTARALPVEYYSLKKRVKQWSARARGTRRSRPLAAFVELPPSPLVGACDCILEMEDAAGVKMRCQVKTTAPPDLAVLCRSFRAPTP
jgi:hypothetical protein